MGKVIFWLVWALEVAGFVFLGGCFVLLLGYGGGSMDRDGVIAWAIIAIAAVGMIFGLIKAVSAFKAQAPPERLALFLAIPPLVAFAAFGSCMLIFR